MAMRLTRRAALQSTGLWAAYTTLGCSESSGALRGDDAGDGLPDAEAQDAAAAIDVGADGGQLEDASSIDAASADGGTDVPWLSGGTAGLADTYPNPFEALGAQCVLTCRQTLGPCYVAAETRRDISDGYPGLPMRLLLRVVREQGCVPVANAAVDVWHTDNLGVYSGPTPSSICNPTNRDVSAERFFRGVQRTDAEGIAGFDSVLPGWYPGRTCHVHYTVSIGPDEWVTSQLYFDAALTASIYERHPDYVDRGAASVTNSTDGLIADGSIAGWQKMSDGALLCWSTIVLRDALADPLC